MIEKIIERIRNGRHIQGWLPDRPDPRDKPFGAFRSGPASIAPTTDLRSLCSPVENQGEIGSCVANATAGNLELLRNKQQLAAEDFSRLFIYYNARYLRCWQRTDSGCYIRDAIKTLASWGVCPESQWPYDVSRFKKEPSRACYRSALKFQILSYYRLSTLSHMKQCLSDGFPFVFGFSVPDSFFSAAVERTGIMPMPTAHEKFNGGHAVMAVGYKMIDYKPYFIVRNSWGTTWGDKGYFYMPEAFISNPDLCDDFWTVRSQEQGTS
jgi:C1A family cysteine protease